MTNKFYLSRFFDIEEYADYIGNLISLNKINLLNEKFDNDVINSSFTWSDTMEGSNYWSDLHEKLQDESDEEIFRNFFKLMII